MQQYSLKMEGKKQQSDQKSQVSFASSRRSRSQSRPRGKGKSKSKQRRSRRSSSLKGNHLLHHKSYVGLKAALLTRNQQLAKLGEAQKASTTLVEPSYFKASGGVLTPIKVDEKMNPLSKVADDLKLTYDMMCKEFDMMRTATRSIVGDKAFNIHLSVKWSPTSSAGGAPQAPVFRIRPSDASEFTSLAALFDEYKCIAAANHCFIGRSTAGANDALWAGMAYDPQIVGAYSSVEQTIIAAQHMGPIQVNVPGASPAPFTHTGAFDHFVKMPGGNQYEYGAVTGIGTGSWTDVQTTAVDYGYEKMYVTACSGGGVTTVDLIMVMYVLFRCRS